MGQAAPSKYAINDRNLEVLERRLLNLSNYRFEKLKDS